MSHSGNDLLEQIINFMPTWEDLNAEAIQEIRDTVLRDIQEFPEIVFEHEDLPTHRTMMKLRGISLFPLGEYRRIYFTHYQGHTTLYIGSDRKLYEYGPASLRESEMDSPIDDNPTELREVSLDKLSVADLYACRDALRRVQIV